jgi:hypothetical protein
MFIQNKLRMALDPDYYIPKESPKTHRTHLGKHLIWKNCIFTAGLML